MPEHLSANWPRQLLRSTALYALAFVAFATAAISMPSSGNPALLLSSAIVGALIAVYLGFLISEVGPDTRYLGAMILTGGMVDVVFNFVALQYPGSTVADHLMAIPSKGLANLGVLCAATGAGLLVAKGLREPRYLIMAAVVGAITDIFSVYAGPTKSLVKTELFPYLAYHWGLIGRGGVVPCVGMGDFIFLVLYFAGVRKFGLDQKKTLIAMCVAFIVGFLTILVSRKGVPALPFMSFALLAVHLRALKQMR